MNFWGSWCVPCREEFPLLLEQQAALGPTDGLHIVGVLYKDDPAAAKAFETEFGATWPSLPDPTGRFAELYRVVAPPQTYFIDADGILRAIHIGQLLEEDFSTLYPKIAP